MKNCSQFRDQNVLQHGQSVWTYFQDLCNHLDETPLNKEWRIPEWFLTYKTEILSVIEQQDDETLRHYMIYHDCGKPFCRTVDEQGRQHFPGHAEVSYNTWLSFSSDQETANLIRRDMQVHTMKAEDVIGFCENKSEACILLLAALCEVHSNAVMFGGIQSDGFKMKWKQVDKRGKAICKVLFGEK
ncbi:MAG: hypothetical protein WC761_02045 [Candidatus Paceibacterota bacterium]